MDMFKKIICLALATLFVCSAFAQQCDIPSEFTGRWSDVLHNMQEKCQVKCHLTNVGFNGDSMVLLQCVNQTGRVVYQEKTNGCPSNTWWDTQISALEKAILSGQCPKR